jgi:hypothetical protein
MGSLPLANGKRGRRGGRNGNADREKKILLRRNLSHKKEEKIFKKFEYSFLNYLHLKYLLNDIFGEFC